MLSKTNGRRYRKVEPQVWQDRGFRAVSPLRPSAQALFLYLLTCPETGMIPGVVTQGIMAIAEVLAWSVEDTRTALHELEDQRMVVVDLKARVIWLPRCLPENQPENPNVILGWARSWHELPQCDLVDKIHEELWNAVAPRGEEFVKAFRKACPDRSGKGSQDPLPNGLPDGSAKGSGNQDPEHKHKHEHEHEHEPDQDPEQQQDTGLARAGVPYMGSMDGDDGEGIEPGYGSGRGSGEPSKAPSEGYSSRRYSLDDEPPTFDTLLDDDPPVLQRQGRDAPGKGGETRESAPMGFHPDVQRIFDAWNNTVAAKNSIFEQVTGKGALNLAPRIETALRINPNALDDLLTIFQVIPYDPFYAGKNPNGFVAFLRHYILMSPDRLQQAADVARKKLLKLQLSKKFTMGQQPAAELEATEPAYDESGLTDEELGLDDLD